MTSHSGSSPPSDVIKLVSNEPGCGVSRAVLWLVLLVCGTATRAADPVPESAPAPSSNSGSTQQHIGRPFLGVGSCAASNCHGSDGTRGPTGSEYSVWIQKDPHAEAYSVLFDETSQRMARLLKLDRPAHEAKLCLNCHAPQSDAPFDPAAHGQTAQPGSSHELLTDGVSCEACHGAAGDWLKPHVERDWKSLTVAQKSALGFKDTKDLWSRAAACADCHVGEAGRDVNHDLYAAGHPRLFFELSAFNANLPAHWDRAKDRAREVAPRGDSGKSPFEIKLWAVGQLASADAALELLMHRATTARDTLPTTGELYSAAQTVAVWPEFSEPACFACHHNLAAPGWRQTRGFGSLKAGSLPWGTWLFPLVPEVARSFGNREVSTELSALTSEMSRPAPRRDEVRKLAAALRIQLTEAGAACARQPVDVKQTRELMMRLAGTDLSPAGSDWDGATQTWLALVALELGLVDLTGQRDAPSPRTLELRSQLTRIRTGLDFPRDFHSPVQYSPFDPARRQSLESLRTFLQSEAGR